jgi:RecJ-like exonuclease
MDKNNFEEFFAALKSAANEFKKNCFNQKVLLISNLDADGISAVSIMIRAMERLNIKYSFIILHQLLESDVKKLSDEEYQTIIFCDLGSGQIEYINKYLSQKKIFILDHHEIQEKTLPFITQINPHNHGYEGSSEISASGVCFLFARELDLINEELAHIAIIGAIGDAQEKNGFIGLNKIIMNIALEKKIIEIKKGPRLFGLESRPLQKLLMYSGDILIPGVTNDFKGSKKFLKELGFFAFEDGKQKSFYDLSDKEKEILIEKIIEKRKEGKIENPEDIITNIYLIKEEKRGPFHDAKEFSTLLNSCGRTDHANLGIGSCLRNENQRKEALKNLKDYKRRIVNSLEWYKHNSESENKIMKGKNYIIINAKDDILSTMIGTLASMISKNKCFEKNIFVLSMARNNDNTTKISLRVSNNPDNVDLKKIISEITERIGGEAGGHQYAAGAIISSDKENEFIECAKKIFDSFMKK